MNERTCLLCGKPLSRIRVGSGEEFCSREHRTQYRLRRGMDRLQEANKVASLMRRRENPKPIEIIPVAEMMWHGYFQAMPEANPPVRFPREFQLAGRPPGFATDGYLSTRPSGEARKMDRRLPKRPAREPRSVVLRQIRARRELAMPRAEGVSTAIVAAAENTGRRATDLLHRTGERQTSPPKLPPFRVRTVAAVRGSFQQVRIPACEGVLLRVSRAIGFKLPAGRTLSFAYAAKPTATGLRQPGLLDDGLLVPSTVPHPETGAMAIPFPKRAMDPDVRWHPQPRSYAGTRVPRPVPIATRVHDIPVFVDPARMAWTPQDFIAHGWKGGGAIVKPGMPSMPRLRPLQSVLSTPQPAGRVAVVPFGSSEISLGYPEEEQPIQ